ncbi:MAG: ABC transporter ATP-binding protein [Pseudomonadota bacterium]|nr:ABC transporter ATP-binding protein [Pseudomonadota bacterium]
MRPGPAILEALGIVAYYGPVCALSGVDVSVDAGGIACVIGPNGAGKTTLMRTLAGLLRAREGRIVLEGRAIERLSPDAVVKAGLSLVPEGRHVFASMSVTDNLELGAYTRLRRGELIESDLERVYAIFPRLKERSAQLAGLLSGGEQQMLAIGRALMSRPRLLLLDEPSMGLAPLVVAEIFRVIAQLHRQGTTVLLAEQNAHMALSVANYAYVLESGCVVKHGPAAQIADDDAIREAYLGGA